MERTAFFLALMIPVIACGGDSASDDTPRKTHAMEDAGAPGLKCGAETCRAPEDAGAACCMDQFTGGCGMMVSGICRPLRSEKDRNCPEPNLSGLPGYTAGTGAISSSIKACCAQNNVCGFDLGIGLGCTAAAQTCVLLPRAILMLYEAQTCDGEPMELPADCGQ